jgi:hypothetical protein
LGNLKVIRSMAIIWKYVASDGKLTSVCLRDHKKLPFVRRTSVTCLTSIHPITLLNFRYHFFI